jgi:hypothetical protein
MLLQKTLMSSFVATLRAMRMFSEFSRGCSVWNVCHTRFFRLLTQYPEADYATSKGPMRQSDDSMATD